MRPPLFSRCLLVLFFAPLWMLLSATARAQSPENETDSLYLGNRVMLAVSAPRQMTINAPVRDFAWSPDGRKIAYFTSSDPLEKDTAIVVARISGGRPHVYFQAHMDPSGSESDRQDAFVQQFIGWSPDGNHIAYLVDEYDAQGQTVTSLYVTDLATGLSRPVPVPSDGAKPPQTYDLSSAAWSPTRDLIAYNPRIDGEAHALVYDAAKGTTRDVLPLMKRTEFLGWQDGDHLEVIATVDEKPTPFVVNAATGTATIVSKRQPVVDAPDGLSTRLNAGAAGTVRLSVLMGPDDNSLEDVKDKAGKSHGATVHLWLSVTPDRPADVHAPPKTSKPIVPPVVLVDTYRYSPRSGDTHFALAPPQRNLPGRTQIAYLISGDLYVADITARTPSVQELIAAGEKLTCPEEQQLAVSDAKQLGLAVIQYCQDYDEHYPMADGFHDEVYPYTKNEEVFQVGSHEFQFMLDGDTLASIDNPSTTEIGYFDLPCGRVVTYADGRVKVEKKEE